MIRNNLLGIFINIENPIAGAFFFKPLRGVYSALFEEIWLKNFANQTLNDDIEYAGQAWINWK